MATLIRGLGRGLIFLLDLPQSYKCPKPHPQRHLSALKDRLRSPRRLMTTRRTFVHRGDPPRSLHDPILRAFALRAHKSFEPALVKLILPTGFLIRKLILPLEQCHLGQPRPQAIIYPKYTMFLG